jgi:hypothetical protein
MKNRILGLKLLEEALARPSGECLPEHPCALLIPSHEEYHNDCNRPSACAPVHRPSRDRRGDHRGVVRRQGK